MRVFSVACFLLCALALCIPVSAVETGEDVSASPEIVTETVTTSSGDTVNVNVTVPVPSVETGDVPSLVYSTSQFDDAAPAGEDTLSGLIEALFGTYTPRTQTVTEHLSDGSTVTYTELVPGVAGMDWHWLGGVSLFAMTLWSLFCLIGGVLKRG